VTAEGGNCGIVVDGFTAVAAATADKNRPNQSITVSLWLNGRQVASTTANGSRSDVGAVLSDNGLHGFTLPIPASCRGGTSHAWQIYYESSNVQIGGAPTTFTSSGIRAVENLLPEGVLTETPSNTYDTMLVSYEIRNGQPIFATSLRYGCAAQGVQQ
jgi:hypothetical protein